MKFTSPHHAFSWSYEILDVWRAGSGFDPNPDHLGGGGTGAMGAVILALSVEMIADRHDPGICRQPHPRDRDKSWFTLWFIDQPVPRNWTHTEKYLLERALCAFCKELHERGLAGMDCPMAGRCNVA